MKPIFIPLLYLALAFLFSSCLKEKLDPANIEGNWEYEAVRFTGNKSDSTVPFKGNFTFQKSTSTYNAGGTVYGDFCAGSGDFPTLAEVSPGNDIIGSRKIDFNLTKAQEPDNYNYRNFYTGRYGYLYQGLNSYGFVRMCLISKDEINIRFERSQNSYYRFNVQSMKLKRK